MPKGRIKKNQFNTLCLSIAFSLVKIVLIKIGNTPLRILQFTILVFLKILHLRFSILHFVRHKRTAGRPKKFHLSKKAKVILGLSASTIFLVSYTIFILTAAYQLPTPTRLASQNKPLTTEFYDKNGNLLYRLYESSNRTLVNIKDVPKELIQATLATEDQNFYHHIGIDPVGIARAIYNNIINHTQEGASTITQQLIKNSLLTSEKSYVRKMREAVLALWAERIYSKEEILQMYFNETPYGGEVIGIAAAAETYFGKPPSNLSLAESTYLSGLPASPTEFSPYGEGANLAKLRQKEVLLKMVGQKYITQTQADSAYAEKLIIKPLSNNILAPHFVFYIKDLLTEQYGQRLVSQGGLKIYTSLDLNLQEKLEKIVKEEVDKLAPLNVQNGAAMIIDASSAQILAMVGSRDYHYPNFGNFNVTLALRQPGSTIKPITYAAAFEKGFTPDNLILDIPVTFKNEWGNSYSPVNYDGKFRGPVTLRQALGSSLNIPAVKLLATIGLDPVIQTAQNLGITTFTNPKRYGLALTLGGAEVKMIDMMGVYGTFSRNGLFSPPTGIIKVTDSSGNILSEYKNSPKQVLSPTIAYLITNILSDDNARKMAFGTNSLLNIPGVEVAVKTGTSDNKRDNWTFGYTPKYVVGVWVGNPDNSPMNPILTSGITGAAPIWNKIMHTLLDGSQPLAFEKPTGITQTIPKSMVRVTKNQDKIIFSDNFSTYATSSAQISPTQPNL